MHVDESTEGEPQTWKSYCMEEQRRESQGEIGRKVDYYLKPYAGQETKEEEKVEPEPIKEEQPDKVPVHT